MDVDPLASARDIAARVQGWDLSPIRSTRLDPGPAWEYEDEARQALGEATTALDVGTGGGEVLSRIADACPGSVYATEQWPPNARLAAGRLGHHGIPVVQAASLRPPFRSGAFDLILARHEEFGPAEVDRLLVPGGVLLTQQVSSHHWPELRAYLPHQAAFPNHDLEYATAFEATGYEVEVLRCRFRTAFATIADLGAMLLVAPWEVPGFDLERDRDALLRIERELAAPDGIVLSEGRYLLRAVKPGTA